MKETGAIIGRVGSGKTFTAKGMVERMLEELARVCIIDPTGVWWGLRSSADGKSPAFPVVVFGGDHADVPLAETSGAALAETLSGRNLPAIVDVSEFTSAGRTRFMTAFLEELYNANRSPLRLIIDEADMFAPQRPGKDQLHMLGRMEQICRRGRVRGFAPWLITQRPASLNKNVLSQANTVIAMQLTAPQDRDALGDWIEGQADRADGKRILAELPKLKKGEGFVWAPHHGVLERVKFPPITTYDSSRTPEEGEPLPQVALAAVDLTGLMDSLEEESEELRDIEDVETLRREFVKEIDDARNDAFERGKAEGLRERESAVDVLLDELTPHAAAIQDIILRAKGLLAPAQDEPNPPARVMPHTESDHIRVQRPALDERSRAARATMDRTPTAGLSKAERLILSALAQYHPRPRSHIQVALITGYSHGGGGYRNALGALRTAGRIAGENTGLVITEKGLKDLGSYVKLPTGRALLAHWMKELSKAESKILEALAEVYPRTLTVAQIANRAGYEPGGGGFRNALGRLRTLDLIHGKADIKASQDLFQ